MARKSNVVADGIETPKFTSERQRGVTDAQLKKQLEPHKAKVIGLRAKIKEHEEAIAKLREEYSDMAETVYQLVDIAPWDFKGQKYQAWMTRGGFHVREVEDRGTF